jgi:hypothetical protein
VAGSVAMMLLQDCEPVARLRDAEQDLLSAALTRLTTPQRLLISRGATPRNRSTTCMKMPAGGGRAGACNPRDRAAGILLSESPPAEAGKFGDNVDFF